MSMTLRWLNAISEGRNVSREELVELARMARRCIALETSPEVVILQQAIKPASLGQRGYAWIVDAGPTEKGIGTLLGWRVRLVAEEKVLKAEMRNGCPVGSSVGAELMPDVRPPRGWQ